MASQTQEQDRTLSTSPAHADAQLLVQLAELGQSMRVDRGQALLWKHHQKEGLTFEQFEATYATDSDDAVAIINVLKWFETVGTLVKQGLLDRGLILDWLWVPGMWDLCRPIALGQRERLGEKGIWENFEALAAPRPGG